MATIGYLVVQAMTLLLVMVEMTASTQASVMTGSLLMVETIPSTAVRAVTIFSIAILQQQFASIYRLGLKQATTEPTIFPMLRK